MMKSWPKVALGEVCQAVDRYEAPASGTIYRQLGVRLWGEGAYEREPIDGSNTKYAYFNRIEVDDLVMNKIWARNGSVAIASLDQAGTYVSTEFPAYRLDCSRIEPSWMRLITKWRGFWAACDEKAQGTSGKNRIKPQQFLSINIPLPPLTEQKAIVLRLDALANKVRQINEHLDAIEAHAERLLAVHFRTSIDGAPLRTMAEVAPLVRREQSIDPDGSYPELGIRSFGKGTFHKPPLTGTEIGTKRLFRIEPGDLIFSNVFAWEGAIAIAQPKDTGRFGSHRFITCVANVKHATAEFLRYFFLTTTGLEKIGEASPGGAGRNRTLGLEKLMVMEIPCPSIATQRAFNALQSKVIDLKIKHAAIREANAALIPAMLERLFKQQATPSSNKAIPLPVRTKTDSSPTKNFFYRRVAIDAYIVHALADDPHLGRTKLEKISHLIEYHCHFNLNRQPVRDAYGPNDYPSRRKVEGFAGKQNWYACVDASNRAGVTYVPGEKIADALPVAEDALADRKPAVDALIELLRPLDTKQCEIIATLYAAWNDLLLRGEHPSDKALLLEATERWHPNKLSIPAPRWHKGIEWLRVNEIIPIGQGRPVPEKKETSQ